MESMKSGDLAFLMPTATRPSTQLSARSIRTILKVFTSEEELVFVLTPGKHSLGRSKHCSLRVNHLQVSRHQAMLEMTLDGQVKVSDGDGQGRASTNGTRVNGSPIQERWLTSGMELRFGKQVVAYFHQLSIRQTSIAHPLPEPLEELSEFPDYEEVPTELSI